MIKEKHKILFFPLLILSTAVTTGAMADLCLHGGYDGRTLIEKEHSSSLADHKQFLLDCAKQASCSDGTCVVCQRIFGSRKRECEPVAAGGKAGIPG